LAVEAGDYVVHEVHGIGLCMGTTVIKGDYGEKDYIVVRYRNNDTLYVPVESSNLLSRYSGSDTAPKLSALGGGEFEKVKAKVKANIKELAIDLVKLYNDRMRPRGFVYCNDEELSRNFAEAFPYKETDDQLRCIRKSNPTSIVTKSWTDCLSVMWALVKQRWLCVRYSRCAQMAISPLF
jgi:Transcription-repair coupling factor (superfamily II helicase)